MKLKLNEAISRLIFVGWTSAALSVSSCSGDKDGKKPTEPVSASGAGDTEGKSEASGPSVSADRKPLITSLSNNQFTSKAIDKARAGDFVNQFGGGKSKDINALAAVVAANRLAGKSVNEGLSDAKHIADLEMSKGVERDIPEIVQLELGLTGVQTGRLAFAEFWLDKLLKSKSASIRASAINAKGVMAVRMDRLPEAMVLFKEALAADSDYKPALLNMGFLALQGGDAATARRALGGMQEDWYVLSGLISVHRLEGEADKADANCDRVLSKHPKHKPTLINCGINAWQGKHDYKKAREYLNKALAVAGGAAVWDEKSGKLLGAIDADEARSAQLKAQKEAEERKAKSEAEKAKATPAQPQQTGSPGGVQSAEPAQTQPSK